MGRHPHRTADARDRRGAENALVRFLALATSNDGWFAALGTREAVELAAAEARRAWELHEAGVISAMYWRTDRRDVVIELDAAHEDEARAALATLPFVALGGISFELIGLRPYDGWRGLGESLRSPTPP